MVSGAQFCQFPSPSWCNLLCAISQNKFISSVLVRTGNPMATQLIISLDVLVMVMVIVIVEVLEEKSVGHFEDPKLKEVGFVSGGISPKLGDVLTEKHSR